MSRSGYSEDCDGWQLIRWRGAVASAIRGERGQAFLKEMLAALDAMPVKRLIAHDLVTKDGVCAIGSVAVARGTDLNGLDMEDEDHNQYLANRMGIAKALTCEIEYINDEDYYSLQSPEERFKRVYQWVKEQIKVAAKQPLQGTVK